MERLYTYASTWLALPVLVRSGRGEANFRGYFVVLIALIALYLAAIFSLDNLTECPGDPTLQKCYTYSQLEWSFSASKFQKALDTWSPRAVRAMCLSAGLHVFSAFLFAQLFIFGGSACLTWYQNQGFLPLATLSRLVCLLGRLFTPLYAGAHATIGALLVAGSSNPSGPPAVGVVLITALIVLIFCSLFIIAAFIHFLIVVFLLRKPTTPAVPYEAPAKDGSTVVPQLSVTAV